MSTCILLFGALLVNIASYFRGYGNVRSPHLPPPSSVPIVPSIFWQERAAPRVPNQKHRKCDVLVLCM